MIQKLSPRERRALLSGAAAISAILLVGRGMPAYLRQLRASRDSAAELTTQLRDARLGAATLPAVRDSAAARSSRVASLAPLLLGGDSRATAGAALASLVSGAAARSGVEIGTVELASDTAQSGVLALVRVRANASGDLPGLVRMFALLEGERELLVIPTFSLEQPDAGGPSDHPESLRLAFTVEGLALEAPDSSSAGSLGSRVN